MRLIVDYFGVPSVGIHLLDDQRQWVKAFEGQRFTCPREESVCQFTLSHDDLLVIPDKSVDRPPGGQSLTSLLEVKESLGTL